MKTVKHAKLSELATFRNGLNFSKENRGMGCTLIGVPDFGQRVTPDYSKLKEINPEGIAGTEDYLQKGDVLFVRSNGNKALVGRSLFIDRDIRGLFSGFCIRARLVDDRIDPRFFAYFTKSDVFKAQIASASGTNINNLNQDILGDAAIPLFPKDMQRSIVALLRAFDQQIELNNQINAELEGIAKLLYDYWFVQFDFPISADHAAAMGNPKLKGKPYRTSGGKMVFNPELKREIPEGWRAANIEDIGTIVGGSTPSTENSEYFSTSGTPWITPKDLSDNVGNRFIHRGQLDVTEAGIQAASLRLLPTGTVLMSSRAPIGYLAIAQNPVTTNQGFKSFLPNKGYSSDFIYFTLKSFMKLIEANASGSTFKEISGGTLRAVKIHLPAPNPSHLISDFSKAVASLSEQQSLLETQNRELTQLRDWLLPMLMNGQVTISGSAVDE